MCRYRWMMAKTRWARKWWDNKRCQRRDGIEEMLIIEIKIERLKVQKRCEANNETFEVIGKRKRQWTLRLREKHVFEWFIKKKRKEILKYFTIKNRFTKTKIKVM